MTPLRVRSRVSVNAFWAWVESHGVLHGVGFVLGALVGSFLNVIIVRLPRGQNIAWPGSHCP
ncbi:MAG: prepilin peptidase, partial [Myxococcota bacterium]